MLIDKYLPLYDFKEAHSIEVDSSARDIYCRMLQTNFSNSSVIKMFFKLRGMPKDMNTIHHLTKAGFIKLDEEPGREILFGMVANSPWFNSCEYHVAPTDFIQKKGAGIIKAVINFHVKNQSGSKHIISTETRVWCGSKKMKVKFRLYWFFVKPFSHLIRKSMLKQMKGQIEHPC